MNGEVVIVTGAFGALGSAVAKAFADRGARIILIDKAEYPPTELRQGVGQNVSFRGGVDIADPEVAVSVVNDIQSVTQGVDVLVNVAGGFRWQTIADGDFETWDLLYRLNVQTAVNMCRAVIPVLTKGGRGRIINIGAGAAVRATTGMGAYAASKAGVHRLTEALADELKGLATVNAVLPTIIDTPQNRRDMPGADFSAWVTPAALASVILYIASKESADITGTLIPVSGRI
jgi:NAD(P)-dependent dehydrogenase (short-subunit alcohol dehydrogenase family)